MKDRILFRKKKEKKNQSQSSCLFCHYHEININHGRYKKKRTVFSMMEVEVFISQIFLEIRMMIRRGRLKIDC